MLGEVKEVGISQYSEDNGKPALTAVRVIYFMYYNMKMVPSISRSFRL